MQIDFTSEQKRIFDFVQFETGNGIIDAVAGSGKTTTIMECTRFVQNANGNALFCAFNKSISTDIQNKLNQKGQSNVTVKTIHALGWQILTSNNHLGTKLQLVERKFDQLLKTDLIQKLLKPNYEEIIRINGLSPEIADEDKYEAFAIKNLVYKINKRLLNATQKIRATLTKSSLAEFRSMIAHFGIFNDVEIKKASFDQESEAYFKCSMILLNEGNELSKRTLIMDYTDMIYLPYEWKLQSPVKYDFIFVDECQDLSKAQLAIVLKYGHEKTRLFSVGDPRQSIYGFTGADIASFNTVKSITQAKQLPLTSCFRCPQKVVELAKNIRTDIAGSKKEDGEVINITQDRVIELAKSGDLIISRMRAPLLVLVFNFIDNDRKVQIHQDDVTDILNEMKNLFKHEELQLRLGRHPGGFSSLKRTAFERAEWALKKDSDRIINPVERTVYLENQIVFLKKKFEFLHRKNEQWKIHCKTVGEIIERVREFISATEDSVKLSTIHKAKGLENDCVFILDYDLLPLQHLEQKEWEKEQELNLKYVAITRSRKKLYLVQSSKVEVLQKKSLFDILPFEDIV